MFVPENMKKTPSKVDHNRPTNFFFQYCQPAQNQPKSHILFHKNGSLRDFYIPNDFGFRQQLPDIEVIVSDRDITYLFLTYKEQKETVGCPISVLHRFELIQQFF